MCSGKFGFHLLSDLPYIAVHYLKLLPNCPLFAQHTSQHTSSGEHIHSQKIWDTEAAQQMLVERELTIQDFEDSLELKFRSAI